MESKPGFELEQDYFDWEMAVTGIADMVEEIEQLREWHPNHEYTHYCAQSAEGGC
jgi:hypothetical protein